MTKPILMKNIFQIKYPPKLKFYELLVSSAIKLDDYKDWETDKLSISLQDFQNQCSVFIKHDSTSYEQDSSDMKLSELRTNNIIQKLFSSLQIEDINRFGFREKYLIPIDIKFESLVTICHKKFFADNKELRKVLPFDIDDLGYRVNFFENDYPIYLTVGPVKKSEIARHIDFNIDKHLNKVTAVDDYKKIIDSYPDVALFIDVDVMKVSSKSKDIEFNKINEYKKFAREKIDNIVNGLNNYVFSTNIKREK